MMSVVSEAKRQRGQLLPAGQLAEAENENEKFMVHTPYTIVVEIRYTFLTCT